VDLSYGHFRGFHCPSGVTLLLIPLVDAVNQPALGFFVDFMPRLSINDKSMNTPYSQPASLLLKGLVLGFACFFARDDVRASFLQRTH
jgi:hypothetical protein